MNCIKQGPSPAKGGPRDLLINSCYLCQNPADRVLSIETRAKISLAHKRTEGSGMFGKIHSEHSKELMSLAQSKKKKSSMG
jgi:hypothetical protein